MYRNNQVMLLGIGLVFCFLSSAVVHAQVPPPPPPPGLDELFDAFDDADTADAEDVTETRVCTADAKQCPDGSYVSRTGPNCEFAACPEAPVCAGDVRICPDGTQIRRTDPGCRFPVCPIVVPIPEPTACSDDRKRCPDGSYVFRSGEECLFTACPEVVTEEVEEGVDEDEETEAEQEQESAPSSVQDEEDATEDEDDDLPPTHDDTTYVSPVLPDVEAPAPIEVTPKSDSDVPVVDPVQSNDEPRVPSIPEPTYTFAYADIVFVVQQAEVWNNPGNDSLKLGVQARGAQGMVVDGPVQIGRHMWWEIEYADGVDGWTVESLLTTDSIAQVRTDDPDDAVADMQTPDSIMHEDEDAIRAVDSTPTEIVPWWPTEDDDTPVRDGFFGKIVGFFTSWFK